MSGKILFNGTSPVTQKKDAVDALAAYLEKEISGDGVLDLGSFKLVRSNKGDAFYGVTAKACSCPSAAYRPGQTCKHQRKYFPQSEAAQNKPKASEPLIKRGGFKPFDELPGERAAKASSLSAIDVAYHSIREDKVEA